MNKIAENPGLCTVVALGGAIIGGFLGYKSASSEVVPQ
jgi:hypothetical protein